MAAAFDALMAIRQTMKFYDLCLDGVREQYHLTKIEVTIISFLKNNLGHDTAAEISDMRMLSKGNVSRGADELICRGLLERIPDKTDRRVIHLRLLPEAAPIVEAIEAATVDFSRQIFEGFTPEDMMAFHNLNMRLSQNVSRNLERSAPLYGE